MTSHVAPAGAVDSPSVLVFGGLFLEVVFGDIGEFPRPGTEVFSSSFGISWGGALTVAVAARRVGASVGLVAPLGEDLTSLAIDQFCARNGIDVSAAQRVPGVASGVTVALNFEHDRALITYHPERVGGGRHSSGWWAEAIRRARPQWIYLHAGPEAVEVVAQARALGCRIALDIDLGTVISHRAAAMECLRYADLFLPNEQEMLHLGGDTPTEPATSLEAAVRTVLPVCATVVVKRGLAGATVAREGSLRHVSDGLRDVEVVDRTGAGDSFAGALLGGLAQGWPIEEAVAAANTAGSRAVGHLGAVGDLPGAMAALALNSLHELGRPGASTPPVGNGTRS